jgi:hypothetical protein
VKCPLKSLNFKGKLINHPENPIDESITGWCYTYPSEKYEFVNGKSKNSCSKPPKAYIYI